jgi:hypothetical protein
MDELIGRLVAETGIGRAAAEKAVGIILDFLVKEGHPDKVQPLLAKLPGAQALIGKADQRGDGTGSMGGVMGAGMRTNGGGSKRGAGAERRGSCSRLCARKGRRGYGRQNGRRDSRFGTVCLNYRHCCGDEFRLKADIDVLPHH